MARHKLNWGYALSVAVVSGWTALNGVGTVWAQPPEGGGEDFAMRILRRYDRDEDGVLDAGELEQASRLREYMERQGVDVGQPIPLSVAANHQMGMFQEMQSQRGGEGFGRGGFGGFSGRSGGPGGFGSSGSSNSSDGGGRSRGDRDRGGSDRSSRGGRGESGAGSQSSQKGGTPSKVRVGRVGAKLPFSGAALPSQYAGKDANRDGQIGLYEWSKTDLSTFRRLDTNGDGFLTPAELINPGSGNSGSMASTSSVPSFAMQSGTSGSGSFASAGNTASAKPAAPAGPPVDPKTAQAESAFDYLDKADMNGQKDGALSAEEFARSRNASKMFADAKIEIQFPLTKQKFVENYVKLLK